MSEMTCLSQYQIDLITEFFQYVDTDGDGYITADEIKAACTMSTQEFESDKEGMVYFRDVSAVLMNLEDLLEFNRHHIYSKQIRIFPPQ